MKPYILTAISALLTLDLYWAGESGASLLEPAIAQAAVPSNDHFTNRLVLNGAIVSVTNDNSTATTESGERLLARTAARGSLWYEWTAPGAGLARVYAHADGFTPLVAVYRGEVLRRLRRVAYASGYPATTAVASFSAQAGTRYLICVDGAHADARGAMEVGVDLTNFRIVSPLAGAFIQGGSPAAFEVSSTAPEVDGDIMGVTYHVIEPDGDLQVAGVSTEPPFSITPADLPPGRVNLVAIGTNSMGVERVSQIVPIRVSPVNDQFADGILLEGYQWEASGYTSMATRQKGEPGHGAASVWWRWTAPSSGQVEIRAQLGEEQTAMRKRALAVYTGSDVGALKRVVWTGMTDVPDASKYFRFDAIGGTTYHIVVAAKNGGIDPGTWPFLLEGRLESVRFVEPVASGYQAPVDLPVSIETGEDPANIQRVEFRASDGYTNGVLISTVHQPPFAFVWSNAPSGDYTLEARVIRNTAPHPDPVFRSVSVHPVNDSFSSRIVLETNLSWMSGRIAGASREPDEPAHGGSSFVNSAWWTWTAPFDGALYFSDPTGRTASEVYLYSGTNLASLASVTSRVDLVQVGNRIAEVESGVPYQFAVRPGTTPDANVQLRLYTAPANDDFSSATLLSGTSANLESHTVLATREAAEPAHAGFSNRNTVWWKWTAPEGGWVTLSQAAGIWVIAAVYTGDDLSSLEPVAESGSLYTPLQFEVGSNTTYRIALVTYWGDEERVAASLGFTPAVLNDSFASRLELAETNATLIVDNRGASTEAGEPAVAGGGSGRTVWCSWTAPADGLLYLGTPLLLPAVIDVFQGDVFGALEPVVANPGHRVVLPTRSNEVYHIRFDSGGFSAAMEVELDFVASPENDAFSARTILSGTALSTNGTVRGATPEPGDPSVWPGWSTTVWYEWTAPATGSFVVTLPEKAEFYAVQVYAGSSLSNLTVAGSRHQADSVLLHAVAGNTYFVAVAGSGIWEPDWPWTGPFRLEFMPGDRPDNDNFAGAEVLAGVSPLITGTNWVATLEPADPPLVQWRNLKRTLWYQWTAPASGLLVLGDAGSSVNPVVGTYLGENLNSLVMIGGSETPVRSNEIVRIMVDGDYGAGGLIRLQGTFLAAPSNDEFASATPISGVSCVITGEVRTATGGATGGRFTFAYRDAWWRWISPGDGWVTLTNRADASPLVQVFTGTNEIDLVPVASFASPERSLQFMAVAGATFYIRGTWGAGPEGDHLNLLLSGDLQAESGTAAARALAGSDLVLPPALVHLSSPRMNSDGCFAFTLEGAAGSDYQVERSRNLIDWEVIQSGRLPAGGEEFLDCDPFPEGGFYRAR